MNNSVLRLTKREREILHQVSLGLNTNEIAGKLFISDHTVICHRKNIMNKMEAKNTAQMIRIGFESLLLQPSTV